MTEPRPAPLEPVPEEWERGLAIVAHPDDIEYAAAAMARWTDQGKYIAYCLLTSGEAGIDGIDPEQSRPLREQEQRNAAAIVGVHDVEFLGYPDGMLEYGIGMRRDLARVLRRHRPDMVITGNFRETWDGTALNQPDHIVAGRAALDAARDAGNRWVFRELLDNEGLEPWPGVKAVLADWSPMSTHAVDVTDMFDRGLESYRAHKVYLDGLGPDAPDPQEFMEGLSRMAGTRLGTRFAVAFELLPLHLL
jgi:LmbE family N-acetylglucosaminyl deacetylase